MTKEGSERALREPIFMPYTSVVSITHTVLDKWPGNGSEFKKFSSST